MKRELLNYTIFTLGATLVLGLLFIGLGTGGMLLVLAAMLFVIFLKLVVKHPGHALGLSVLLLGIAPFYWAVKVAGLPNIFMDQILLIFYVLAFVLIYPIWKYKQASPQPWGILACLGATLTAQSISFIYRVEYVSARNFVETLVFGAILLVIVFNEADGPNREKVIRYIIITTLVLSVFSVVEKIVETNPIMEQVTDFIYLSPQVAKLSQGYYRPYATFFSPSEAGTFIAMGLPFIWYWGCTRGVMGSLAMGVLGITAIIVNATRGVWVAVAVAVPIFLRRLRVGLMMVLPMAALGTLGFYLLSPDSPFWRRLFDLNNIYVRFFYWKTAAKIIVENPLIGVGHMRFKDIYLDYIKNVNTTATFDVRQIFVADNLYLTTLAEHGLLGLITLVVFFGVVLVTLFKLQRRLHKQGKEQACLQVKVCLMSLGIYCLTGMLADVHLFVKATKFFFIIMGLALSLLKESPPASGAGIGAPVQENPIKVQD